MKISGIYQIQSKLKPERTYIGSAVNIKDRWRCHLKDLKREAHHSKKLQNHFNKYGENDLVFSVLEACSLDLLIIREQYYIDNIKPYFNSNPIAGSQRGRKWTNESRLKARNSKIGTKHSPETKEKIRISGIGRYLTEETKKKISLLKKGKPCPHAGIKHSEESKVKMSIAHRNISEETRKKMSDSAKLKRLSDETKRKISESSKGLNVWMKGRIFTEKTRQKMSESQKKRRYEKI